MIRPQFLALIAATIASSALANPPALAPVEGGFSDRLATMGTTLKNDPKAFKTDLTSTLDHSRAQAHELIDRIIDEGGLPDFLQAMTRESDEDSSLARQLASSDPEQARGVLHSRVERQLASYGQSITQAMAQEDETRLKASFDLALNDLAREENSLVESLEGESPAAPVSSEVSDSPAAPRNSRDGHNGRHDGGRNLRRNDRSQSDRNRQNNRQQVVVQSSRQQVVVRNNPPRVVRQVRQTQRQLAQTQQQLAQTQRQLARTQRQANRTQQNLALQNQFAREQVRQQAIAQRIQADRIRAQRQMAAQAQMQRAAWLQSQARASAWNTRCQSYSTYSYQPSNVNHHRNFPTGYYYRPDRVEKVVKRGLWGIATVAATPFALLASVF